ncbi:MAG: hypothetical protein R3B47_18290 [Bacteroidia bacterium]
MASTPNAGTGYAVDLTSTAGYLGPNQAALAMNRYWNVTATNQPTQPVGVRFYYNDEDVVDLNATLTQDLMKMPLTILNWHSTRLLPMKIQTRLQTATAPLIRASTSTL